MLPFLTPGQWALAVLGAFCVGFAKSGFTGVGLVTVVVMAQLFDPKQSTGVLLPLLICGDVFSVVTYHRHARWSHIVRMLPPTLVGVVVGYLLMGVIEGGRFRAVIGVVVLLMVVLQLVRQRLQLDGLPHARGFAWAMGGFSGFATMLANAAGPVMSLYFLAIGVPKFELVGTSAWFFLIVNVLKVPFSSSLGLISPGSLFFNLLLVPVVGLGIFAGRRLIGQVPQRLFERLLLVFATLAAVRLLWGA